MINLPDFQPLSIAKIKKFSSTTGFLVASPSKAAAYSLLLASPSEAAAYSL